VIPKECKRLAEVDFPIAVVSKHSVREKSIRHGHPSTLHLWWARRPLAACRAMLIALLLPDPCEPSCPEQFKARARNVLPRVQGSVGGQDIDLRNELLRFIADFANWDNAANAVFLEAARALVRAAQGDESPLVADPFAGGGSIPLEALRLGCDAFASDLNPVACLILKTMLEDIPRHSPDLVDELRKVGAEVRRAAETELTEFYPSDPDGAKPIAYLWARTIVCDSCGAEVPLIRSFWLSSRGKRRRAIKYSAIRQEGKKPTLEFLIFEPKSENDVPKPTVSRAKAMCLCCNIVMPPERVRIQLRQQNGGAGTVFDETGKRVTGALLLAVVTVKDGSGGRAYRLPTEQDYLCVFKAGRRLEQIEQLNHDFKNVPDESTPAGGGSGAGRAFSVQSYGMVRFGDLFTVRQKLTLAQVTKAIRSLSVSGTLSSLLSIAFDKLADKASSLCRWKASAEYMAGNTFSRPALPIVWDFCEAQPFAGASGGWEEEIAWVAKAVEHITATTRTPASAVVQRLDATSPSLEAESADVWFTDPPYYDAIPYSDLSAFFDAWLKRTLPPELARSVLASEWSRAVAPEIIQDETKRYGDTVKDKYFFEGQMAKAFKAGRTILRDEGIGCVVFAHKTTEGWEALLSGMVSGGWVVTASWPIATEMAARLRAIASAALGTSVHLVCRPRLDDSPVGDWSEVLRELPIRVGDWIEKLQGEGIRGADLVFACIGPAMEVYSRYKKVEDAEGREIPLGGDPTATEPYKRGFLAYVWETVGRMALEEVLGTAEAKARNGAAGALEEDSRLTALFLWTLQSTEVKDGDAADAGSEEDEPNADEDDEESPKKKKAGYTLIYDVARRFAQPLGIHLDKWEGRIIETTKGIVRLLPVAERTTQLFGDADAAAMARRIEQDVKAQRNYAFAFMQDAGTAPQIKTGKGRKSTKDSAEKAEPPAPQQVTTLDRVHAAMLLQSSGQTNGLRALLREEQQRGPDFIRLANALSALYPKDSEEKRLLDAMLLAVPRN
jgi:putative DNA methylase